MTLTHRTLTLAAALSLVVTVPFAASERIAVDVNEKIREEALKNSQIMGTLHVLTDIHGPRLTGSPNLKSAGDWAIRLMQSWGLAHGRMVPWDWGRPGWTNELAWGAIVAPVKAPLEFRILAWTPGTDGTIRGRAFNLIPPDRPTQAELAAYLESVQKDVAGAMVLVGRHRTVPVNLSPRTVRRTDEQLAKLFEPAVAPAQAAGGSGRSAAAAPQRPAGLSPAQVSRHVDRFLVLNGARVRLNDAGRPHGQIAAFNNPTYDMAQVVPTVVLRNEDYGRISRILAHGTPVELQFTILNETHPEGRTPHNAIAEIPGTDLAGEVVMLGGHLDLDTYERIIEDDAKASVIVIASIVYHLAMRDAPLPRFSAADMPPA